MTVGVAPYKHCCKLLASPRGCRTVLQCTGAHMVGVEKPEALPCMEPSSQHGMDDRDYNQVSQSPTHRHTHANAAGSGDEHSRKKDCRGKSSRNTWKNSAKIGYDALLWVCLWDTLWGPLSHLRVFLVLGYVLRPPFFSCCR